MEAANAAWVREGVLEFGEDLELNCTTAELAMIWDDALEAARLACWGDDGLDKAFQLRALPSKEGL